MLLETSCMNDCVLTCTGPCSNGKRARLQLYTRRSEPETSISIYSMRYTKTVFLEAHVSCSPAQEHSHDALSGRSIKHPQSAVRDPRATGSKRPSEHGRTAANARSPHPSKGYPQHMLSLRRHTPCEASINSAGASTIPLFEASTAPCMASPCMTAPIPQRTTPPAARDCVRTHGTL